MQRLFLGLIAIAVLSSPLLAEDSAATGNIDGYIGAKFLNKDDWEPVENQGAFGILFDIRGRNWPISIAVNTIFSGAEDEDDDSNIDTTGSTSELQVGVKKIWDGPAKMHPFIAGGLAIISAYRKVDTGPSDTDDDDSALGAWLGGGVYWTLNHFNIGPQIAVSGAKVELFGEDVKAGGLHAGLLLGYHW